MLWLACASAARQYNTVVQHARKLISAYQFNNEPVRLLVASLASGLGSTDAFITNTLQKHMLREIKSVDAAVKNRDGMKWHTLKKRYFMSRSGKDDMAEEEMEDEAAAEEAVLGEKEVVPRLPEKDNPMLVAVYGQMSNAAKSYQSAICKWLFFETCVLLLRAVYQSISFMHTITAQRIRWFAYRWLLLRLAERCSVSLTTDITSLLR